jgi:glycosyltransferase involved in cell wall biosynthesis
MRVLHVIPAVGASYGGPSRAIVGMTESLAARGVDVEVATTDRDGPARLDVRLGEAVRCGSVLYHFFATMPSGEWKLSLSLARWLRASAANYDLVHVHGMFSFSTIPACRMARANGIPYVLRPLGMLTPASLSFRSWKKKPYFALVERRHLECAAAIHVTSPKEEEAVRSLGFGDRARLISLGIDTPPINRDSIQRRGSDAVRFLFLGRLHPIKQLPMLIEAFALAGRCGGSNIELVIAGGGNAAYRRELEEMASRFGVSRRVRFAGEVSAGSTNVVFAAADVFVLPSRTENFGLAAAEALGAGLPVIVTEQVGLADDVMTFGAGRVVAPTASALACAMRELAADASLRSSMSASARRLANDRYSWSRSAERLIAVYEDLLSTHRMQRPLAGAS